MEKAINKRRGRTKHGTARASEKSPISYFYPGPPHPQESLSPAFPRGSWPPVRGLPSFPHLTFRSASFFPSSVFVQSSFNRAALRCNFSSIPIMRVIDSVVSAKPASDSISGPCSAERWSGFASSINVGLFFTLLIPQCGARVSHDFDPERFGECLPCSSELSQRR
jgi:hypothetical protein